jgi:hypothetical protein
MAITSTHPCHTSSDDKIPRSILRAMEGAKAFLHSALLKVPWLWRMDPLRIKAAQEITATDLRTYGKVIRSQINVNVHQCFFLTY